MVSARYQLDLLLKVALRHRRTDRKKPCAQPIRIIIVKKLILQDILRA
jgi:hypothetical protein